LEASAGDTVAVNCPVTPAASERVSGFRDTPETGTCTGVVGVTVTLQVAVLFPSAVMTVIVAIPADIAVTKPVAETIATPALLLLQLTV
jgi:hypothetical protein